MASVLDASTAAVAGDDSEWDEASIASLSELEKHAAKMDDADPASPPRRVNDDVLHAAINHLCIEWVHRCSADTACHTNGGGCRPTRRRLRQEWEASANNGAATSTNLRSMLLHALTMDDVGGSATSSTAEPIVDAIIDAIRRSCRHHEDAAELAHLMHRSLADPLNVRLRQSVRTGALTPSQLITMREEALLNPIEQDQRRRRREDRIKQRARDAAAQHAKGVPTTLFTCPACGSGMCYANYRSTDFVKWQGDDATPTLLTCATCGHCFRE